MNDAQLALIRLHDAVSSFLRHQICRDAWMLRNHGATNDEVRAMLEIQQANYDRVEASIMNEAVAFVRHALPDRYAPPTLLQ